MNHEEYVYNEYYDSRLMEWKSTGRGFPVPRKSEEQKFRDKEMEIIFKQLLQDIQIFGLDESKIRLDKNINILNDKVKLWKDKQNEYTTSHYAE